MMFKSILLATILFSSVVSNVRAESSELQNDPALRIASFSVTEVETIAPVVELPTVGAPAASPIGGIITTINGIVAIGEKIWKIVDAGRPVVTTKFAQSISVLPHMEGENPTVNQMANWSLPTARSYRVSFKNSLGFEVVGFTYTIYFQFNGNNKGVGKYITGLRVMASEVSTAWGFSFDATSELMGIANVGSSEAPIASATIQISYAVKGLLNESRNSEAFYVDGAGNIQGI